MDVHNPGESLDTGADLWVIGDRYVWGNNDDGGLEDEIIDESADEKNDWRPFSHVIIKPEEMKEIFEEAKVEYLKEIEDDGSDWSEFDDEKVWDRVMGDGISSTGQGTDYHTDELHLVERRLVWSSSSGIRRGEEESFYDAVIQTLSDNDNEIYNTLAEWVSDHRPDDEPLETRQLPEWMRTFVTTQEEGLQCILELEDETDFMILNDSDLPPWEWRGSYMGGAPSSQIWGAFFREEDGVFYFVSSASDPDTYAQMVELAASFDAVS